MRHLDPVRTDFLVIGGGAAGMLVATYLSERRRDVALVDTGTSCTALSTGCFNGTGINEDMLDFLLPRLMSNGLSMIRYGEQMLLLGNAGNRYRCRLAPQYTALGTLETMQQSRLAVVGIGGQPEVDPELICSLLRQDAGLKADPVHIPNDGRMSLNELCDALRQVDADAIMLPPLFPLRDYNAAMLELNERTGRIVFEPVTPLSLPGLRLAEAMRGMLAISGCRVMDHRRVTKLIQIGGRYDTAIVQTPGTTQEVNFSTLVIAARERHRSGPVDLRQGSDRPVRGLRHHPQAGEPGRIADHPGPVLRIRGRRQVSGHHEQRQFGGERVRLRVRPRRHILSIGQGLLDALDCAWDAAHYAEVSR